MLGEMAVRLWAVSRALANGQADEAEMRLLLSAVCHDMAIKMAELGGVQHDDCEDAIDNESFEPAFKFNKSVNSADWITLLRMRYRVPSRGGGRGV
jgi:hypothetical protein